MKERGDESRTTPRRPYLEPPWGRALASPPLLVEGKSIKLGLCMRPRTSASFIIRMGHFYSKYCSLEAQRKSTGGVPLAWPEYGSRQSRAGWANCDGGGHQGAVLNGTPLEINFVNRVKGNPPRGTNAGNTINLFQGPASIFVRDLL